MRPPILTPAMSAIDELGAGLTVLSPITPAFRNWLEKRCSVLRFNPDRWGHENDMAVKGINDRGEFESWVFIGNASCVGNAFALMADAGLDEEADHLIRELAEAA